MLESVAFLTEGYEAEVAEGCGHVDLDALLDERLGAQAIGYEVAYRHEFEPPLVGLDTELGQTGHCAVGVEYLYERGRWTQTGQTCQVD